jgi:uncharacterized membrane protein
MNKEVNREQMPFTKKNYITILVGVVLLFLGFLLMSGGGEHTATEFDSSIFSFRRITLAPIVVIAGFVVVGFGIMKRFKSKE